MSGKRGRGREGKGDREIGRLMREDGKEKSAGEQGENLPWRRKMERRKMEGGGRGEGRKPTQVDVDTW